MKLLWKIVALAAGVTVILGAAIRWHYVKARVEAHRLTKEAEGYRIRAEQGDADAECRLAGLYREGKGVRRDYAEALRWYRKAADQDNAKAEYAIGYMYYNGEGVPRDDAQAVGWCRKAAEHGESRAEYVLGDSYYYGRGVPQDRSVAAQWYRRAAEHGSARAQYVLGYMYYYGQGVPRDRIGARRLFREAAGRGDEDARRALGPGRARLTTLAKILLAVTCLGSSSWLIHAGRGSRTQQRVMVLTALLVFLTVGLDLYWYHSISVFRFPLAVSVLYLVRNLLRGAAVALLLWIVCQRSTKLVLTACGGLLIAFNLFATIRWDLRSLPLVSVFYGTNGFLIGLLVSSLVCLRFAPKKDTKGSQEL
jgi:hypothetical protein